MSRTVLRPIVPALSLIASAALVLIGFRFSTPTSAAAAPPPVIEVMASDYAFEAPDTLPAGPVTLRLMNHGQESHHAQLLRLNEGVTLDQLTSALQTEGDAALRFVTLTGGPGAIDPSRTTEVTLDLAPGAYVLACFIPGPDGVPHLAKGMLKPLTVTDTPPAQATAPELAGTMTMRDFSFDVPERVPAGSVTYRVVNSGPQPHELNIIRLASGATVDDVIAWQNDPSTPPPFESVGGMNGLTNALDGYMTIDLAPGEYAAICNIPDPSSGLPHSHLGMIRAFTAG